MELNLDCLARWSNPKVDARGAKGVLVVYGVSWLSQGRTQGDGQILADAFFGGVPVWVCGAGLKGTLEAGKRLDQVGVTLHHAASLALAPCDV